MALQQNGGPAPYAPPSAILAVIQAYRERGLQTPFTNDVLIRAGVTDQLASRAAQSLRLLDFIDDDGNPSPEFQALRRAASDEYQARLEAMIRAAYAPIFSFTDPATDTPSRIRDAFRVYEPIGQQERMVTLFLHLCEASGIIDETPTRRPAASTNPERRDSRPRSKTPKSRKEAAPTPPKPPRSGAIPPDTSLLFGVTDEDIAALSESEFNEVWAALGKVARARSRVQTRPELGSQDSQIKEDDS